MAFELRIIGEKILEITYLDIVNKEEVFSMRKNAISMIEKYSLDRIFVNLTQARLDITKVDLFNIAASNKKVYPQICKAAIFFKTENISEEDVSIYKNSANTRGWNIEFFIDKREAEKWLGI